MSQTELLAVVEVERSDRVQCSAEGCGHSVYKQVHIVRQDGKLRVYGSTCFSNLFDGTRVGNSKPHYTSVAGRPLTQEERLLLVQNAAKLIEQFESEQSKRLESIAPQSSVATHPPIFPDIKHWRPPSKPQATPEQRAAVEPEALRRLDEKFTGIDFDLPGFRGLVEYEIDQILRERMA